MSSLPPTSVVGASTAVAVVPVTALDDAHHSDNQRRFIGIEKKLDANTALTEQLAVDAATMIAISREAAVIFKFLRKVGAVILWIRNVAMAALVLYSLWKYGVAERLIP